jgi:prolyl-tRNA synthetase
MKDAYSLDVSQEGLDSSYNLHDEAYRRIFKRVGLNFFVVGASSGLMGGTGSEEFMIESDAGEDTCAICDACGFAANIEVATSGLVDEEETGENIPFAKVSTPGKRTVEEVSEFLGLTPDRFIKSLVFMGDDGLVMVLVRGDEEINEEKLLPLLGASMRPAEPEEVKELIGAEIGYLGPVGLEDKIKIIADNRLKGARNRATGANVNDFHVVGVQVGESFTPHEWADIRIVKAGEPCPKCGKPLKVVQAIELGHIFKLGTKYSSALGATILDPNGKEVPIVMGSYGIGIGRLIAAVIENRADENGIIWPVSVAPYEVVVIALNFKKEAVGKKSVEIYEQLKQEGWGVALDDRDVRPGFKFKDADLLGYPFQVVVSERNLNNSELELKNRRKGEKILVSEEGAPAILSKWREDDIADTLPDA